MACRRSAEGRKPGRCKTLHSTTEVISNALGVAGMRVRRELKRYYGTPDAAAEAVRDASKHRDSLEQWAQVVTAKETNCEGGSISENGTPFSFDALPPAMRDSAAECLAAAMLAYTAERQARRERRRT